MKVQLSKEQKKLINAYLKVSNYIRDKYGKYMLFREFIQWGLDDGFIAEDEKGYWLKDNVEFELN